MPPSLLYATCLVGALGLYLCVRPGGLAGPRGGRMRALGALLGLGALAYLVVAAGEAIAPEGGRPGFFYAVFSLIAVTAAMRMITHSRPVYSALHFVLVVLASAGLFLMLEAEFMAFALVIVYAGAILITYMFVLMLAQQAPRFDEATAQPEYDLNPREPAAGAVVGFILLALLSRMIVDGANGLPPPPRAAEAERAAWDELRRMPGRLERAVGDELDGAADLEGAEAPRLEIAADGSGAAVRVAMADGTERLVPLPPDARPDNVQRVGLALIAKFPVSLELAGVILLMAMFGAVVLARRQIELTEDEKREAAGLRRLGHHDDPAERGGPAAGSAGGEPRPRP